jgi:excisionase family DNA binding protein
MAELMQVRQTARTLGVSENTVRRWAERGLLTAVRLPGSGVRRFRPDEVEGLRRQMFGDVPPVEPGDDVMPVTRVSAID